MKKYVSYYSTPCEMLVCVQIEMLATTVLHTTLSFFS
jgi:hypothetical protein